MLASDPAPEPATSSGSIQLPDDFSPEQDVLVLAGQGAEPWLQALAQHGITRVVVFTPGATLAAGDTRSAASPADVMARILDFVPGVRRITIQRLPASGVSDDEFTTLKKTLENGGMNRATFASSGPLWVRHALGNLPSLGRSPSIDCLKGAFAGKACVLVSPGPSLAKNIAVLKELAGRVLIVAGNRGLRPLRDAGIVPDIVVVADAMDLSYQLAEGLLEGVPALVLDVVSHPAVVALGGESCFFFSAIQEIQESTFAGIGQLGSLGSGGSVATVALTLALHLGAEPIMMVGQDLALTGEQYYIPSAPDGDTRIKVESGIGTFENSSAQLRQAMHDAGGIKVDEHSFQHFIKVPGYYGGEVYTSLQFDTYRRWFGGAAHDHAGKVRLVNCTEGGARIDNMEQKALAQMGQELTLSPFNAAETLAACRARCSRRELERAVEQHIKQLQRCLHETFEEVQRCEKISHQVERAPEQLERLDKAERKLTEAVRKLPFVTALASAEIERARRAGANAKSLSESLHATRRLYAVIKQAVSMARPALSDALQRLKRAA